MKTPRPIEERRASYPSVKEPVLLAPRRCSKSGTAAQKYIGQIAYIFACGTRR